ncbi:hypothetical protein I2W78_16345 [Streptomyces spinoverrucosus]|uniref:hypothetical protein n=1 Tax=Streptomyces spinoverrucosus TaxID=284043 RepID=UPI0018C3B45E|nr:hypothetical protein [Streptomyces spinoverrucosus]MBG0853375.1 hypothetical protein [Streptomyces spinoverrucosus]
MAPDQGGRTYVQITAIERRTAQDATVHNLTVSDVHTYYALAGTTPVLVHNTNGCGPVAYGSTDLSQIAIQHRRQAGVSSGQNVAVHSVELPNGQTADLTFTNTVRGRHSEAHADDFLDELGIDARMSRYTNATLSWSFERGDNALSAIRRAVFGR